MTRDARVILARPTLAASRLEGLVRAERFVQTHPGQTMVPNAAIRAAPATSAEQVNQLLFGEMFDALDESNGFVWGQARRDGYVGWVGKDALATSISEPTHWVRVPRTVVFTAPSIKARVWGFLGLNALVSVAESAESLARVVAAGWVPAAHLAPIGRGWLEPAAAAAGFLGAPYVWGGRDSLGLDCSGLVQQALLAAGLACPRDADQQSLLGVPVATSDLARGDLVFWKGHVGMMLDAQTLLHANAHHMAVAIEPLREAVDRIAAKGAGEVTACRRISPYRANT